MLRGVDMSGRGDRLGVAGRLRLFGCSSQATRVVVAVAVLLVAGCGAQGEGDSVPTPSEQPNQAEPVTGQGPATSQQPAQAEPVTGQGPATSQQPNQAEPGGDPVGTHLSEEADGSDDVDAARRQIKAAVDAYIAPGPPQQLTNAELGCLASSVLDSLSDQRLVGLAPVLTVSELSDGLPSDVLDPAESERILNAASRCVDWPSLIGRSYLHDGSDPQAEPPGCVVEAVAAPRFARRAARVELFEDANSLGDVMGLFGVDCYVETTKERLVRAMAAEGISAESAACVGDRAAQALLAAADAPEGPEAALALSQVMATTLDCLTGEEMELLAGAQDRDAQPSQETEPGFASLDLANAPAGQPGVELSSPNWWRAHTTT